MLVCFFMKWSNLLERGKMFLVGIWVLDIFSGLKVKFRKFFFGSFRFVIFGNGW